MTRRGIQTTHLFLIYAPIHLCIHSTFTHPSCTNALFIRKHATTPTLAPATPGAPGPPLTPATPGSPLSPGAPTAPRGPGPPCVGGWACGCAVQYSYTFLLIILNFSIVSKIFLTRLFYSRGNKLIGSSLNHLKSSFNPPTKLTVAPVLPFSPLSPALPASPCSPVFPVFPANPGAPRPPCGVCHNKVCDMVLVLVERNLNLEH